MLTVSIANEHSHTDTQSLCRSRRRRLRKQHWIFGCLQVGSALIQIKLNSSGGCRSSPTIYNNRQDWFGFYALKVPTRRSLFLFSSWSGFFHGSSSLRSQTMWIVFILHAFIIFVNSENHPSLALLSRSQHSCPGTDWYKCWLRQLRPEASIPSEAMMHFPLFQSPHYFRQIFRLWGKFPKFYLFPKNVSIFICQKVIRNFGGWKSKQFQYISPLFCENYYFPLLLKISPLFSKNSPAFYILYVYLVSPLLWPWCIYAQCTYWTPLTPSMLVCFSLNILKLQSIVNT